MPAGKFRGKGEINLAAAWRFISTLTGKAYSWAVKNVKKVWKWIQDGATFKWIEEQINKIVGN